MLPLNCWHYHTMGAFHLNPAHLDTQAYPAGRAFGFQHAMGRKLCADPFDCIQSDWLQGRWDHLLHLHPAGHMRQGLLVGPTSIKSYANVGLLQNHEIVYAFGQECNLLMSVRMLTCQCMLLCSAWQQSWQGTRAPADDGAGCGTTQTPGSRWCSRHAIVTRFTGCNVPA